MHRFAGKDCYERRVEGGEPAFFEIFQPDNKIESFSDG
jgi:hypothetical protein